MDFDQSRQVIDDLEAAAVAYAKLREKLANYVQQLRNRAEVAGPQAYAQTYRFVADELENLIRA